MATTKRPKKAEAAAAERPATKAPPPAARATAAKKKGRAATKPPKAEAKAPRELDDELPDLPEPTETLDDEAAEGEEEIPVVDEAEEDPEVEVAPRARPPAASPTKAKPSATKKPGGAGEVEAPPVVPARRLTPEAREALNAMLKRGVPLQDALRATAKWETFVAPVREPAPSRFEGMASRPAPRRSEDHDDERPAASGGDFDEEPVETPEE